MEKMKISRFKDKIAEVKYFLIEPRLNLVYAVVGETETELFYYDVHMTSFFSEFENCETYIMACHSTGERYETGEPAKMKKEPIADGIFSKQLDITGSRDEAYFVLTGKKKKAIHQNVIG